MTDEQPAPRSRRVLILWSVALGALILTGVLCWAVVVPVWRTRSVVLGVRDWYQTIRSISGPEDEEVLLSKGLQDLGGPAEAAVRLGQYLRVPDSIAPDKQMAVLLLGHCGMSAVPYLLQALRDEDPNVRSAAAWALALVPHKDETVLRALIAALQDPSASVRMMTARTLGGMGSGATPAAPRLLQALSDNVLEVRICAATALRDIGEGRQQARDALIKLLTEHDRTLAPDVINHALIALGQFGADAAVAESQLTRLLAHPDEIVRQAAAEALKKIKAPSASSGQAAQEKDQ